MKKVFAECGENCYIELPLHSNRGGSHVHFGSDIYANSNLTLVDDGHIFVGDRVLLGPNVTVVTASEEFSNLIELDCFKVGFKLGARFIIEAYN